MTQHEISPVEEQEIDAPQSPIDTAEDVVYEYDPATVSTLSAIEIDEIETRAWDERDEGVEPGEVQAHVYAMLEERGIDLSGVRDKKLVIKFVGVDGKHDLRVINLDSVNFGEPLRRAELKALEPLVAEQDNVTETSKDNLSEQAEMLEGLLASLKNDVSNVANPIEMRKVARDMLWDDTSRLLETVRQLAHQMNQGMIPDPMALRRLNSELVADTVRGFAQMKPEVGTDTKRVHVLEDKIGKTRHYGGTKLDDDHKDVLSDALQKANDVRVDLGGNRVREEAATNQASDVCGQISRVLDEMSSSRHGQEGYASHLTQLKARLEAQVNIHHSSESALKSLLSRLNDTLTVS